MTAQNTDLGGEEPVQQARRDEGDGLERWPFGALDIAPQRLWRTGFHAPLKHQIGFRGQARQILRRALHFDGALELKRADLGVGLYAAAQQDRSPPAARCIHPIDKIHGEGPNV